MSEEEKKAIKIMKQINDFDELCVTCYPLKGSCIGCREKAKDILLNLIEKQQTKIKELEADLYSANKIIDDYIEERNKLKDKMIGDKMEQFDDYVIYLIESYLEIMGE